MNCALRSSSGLAMSKRLFGGQNISFVRNAGHAGPPRPPGDGPLQFPPGPKQMQQLKNWMTTTVMFGATAGAAVVYFTDWRVITDWIPFYNGKYKEQ